MILPETAEAYEDGSQEEGIDEIKRIIDRGYEIDVNDYSKEIEDKWLSYCSGMPESQKLLLSNLVERHNRLSELEKLALERENVLNVTEKLLDAKVDELRSLKNSVDAVLLEYKESIADSRIKSLVRIYENMKPKEASKIFSDLFSPVLVEVISQMNEDKLAPILSNMDPNRARDLTVELANYRRLVKLGR